MTIVQKICGVIAVLIFAAGCFVFFSGMNRDAGFEPPAAEPDAVTGVPLVPEELGYSELNQEGMPYMLHICGVCSPGEDNNLDVYFTNDSSNQVLLALEVYEDDQLIGQTGYLKPGEYVPFVKLSHTPDAGTGIVYKIVGYEPDSFISAGSVTLNTEVS